MNKPNESISQSATARSFRNGTRSEALLIFSLESIQDLDPESTGRCQQLLGHGRVLGVWETPNMMAPHLRKNMRRIDMRERIVAYLPDAIKFTPRASSDMLGQDERMTALLDEAVLWMSRFALLMRMAPTRSGRKGSRRPLDVTTLAQNIYQHIACIIARAVAKRLADPHAHAGFIACLTDEDLRLIQVGRTKVELNRIIRFHDMRLWSDAPAKRIFEGNETNPKGAARTPPRQDKTSKFQHIPDDYMAIMGPRVLWVVQYLGPKLVDLCEKIPDLLKDVEFTSEPVNAAVSKQRLLRITEYLRNEAPIEAPPFLRTKGLLRKPEGDDHQWRISNYVAVRSLAALLQSAHLWVVLLTMGGRIGEIMTLGRDCVEFARDGKCYANGKTYKLSSRIDGEERTWALPEVAVDALAQQARLVTAWERIARQERGATEGGNGTSEIDGWYLWASLGASSTSDPEKNLADANLALKWLAKRLGLSTKPGGKNLHPHRFRKTIARLVGIAIVNSPRILQLVFGHKDIQMTLYYIRSDKALAVEIEKVTRELKIMRCERVLEDMHAARERSGALPLDGYGGQGALVLDRAVSSYEAALHQKGEQWGAGCAHELAEILTAGGRNWTLVSEHSICSKGPGEAGLCSKNLGEPITSNCQSECINRIEEKTGRRDVHRIIPILVTNWKRARDDRQLLVMAGYEDQLRREMARFKDIGAALSADPDVALIMAEGA